MNELVNMGEIMVVLSKRNSPTLSVFNCIHIKSGDHEKESPSNKYFFHVKVVYDTFNFQTHCKSWQQLISLLSSLFYEFCSCDNINLISD